MTRTNLLIPIGLCALLGTLPATAGAAVFTGKTRQGRQVTLVTGADGRLKSGRFAWRAQCRKGRYTSSSKFVRPLDLNVPGRFRDASPPSYTVKLAGGLHARIKPAARGHVGTSGRWRGRFRVDVGVFRGSTRIDTCHLRDDTWSASPTG
jgi:hypothetical protein